MKERREVISDLTAMVTEAAKEKIARTNLRVRIENILDENRITPDGIKYKKSIVKIYRRKFQETDMGSAFRATVNKVKASEDPGLLWVTGAVVFVESDGQEDIAPGILGALGTGCLDDPGELAYLLNPDFTPKDSMIPRTE